MFSVQLSRTDRDHLEVLANCIDVRVRVTAFGMPVIASQSPALIHDLHQAGMIERKSSDDAIVLALERCPAPLRRHFVRGLFDGDGSAFDTGTGGLVLEVSGHRLMLERIRGLVVEDLGVAWSRLVSPANCHPSLRHDEVAPPARSGQAGPVALTPTPPSGCIASARSWTRRCACAARRSTAVAPTTGTRGWASGAGAAASSVPACTRTRTQPHAPTTGWCASFGAALGTQPPGQPVLRCRRRTPPAVAGQRRVSRVTRANEVRVPRLTGRSRRASIARCTQATRRRARTPGQRPRHSAISRA